MWECLALLGACYNQCGKVLNCWGNVTASGKIWHFWGHVTVRVGKSDIVGDMLQPGLEGLALLGTCYSQGGKVWHCWGHVMVRVGKSGIVGGMFQTKRESGVVGGVIQPGWESLALLRACFSQNVSLALLGA